MLESAFAWIGQIAEWVGKFFPRREILDTTEGAIKYSGFVLPQWVRVWCGGYAGTFRITVHEAGIHWWWPYTSKWHAYPTALQTDQLKAQTMESADGVTFMTSATLTYEVTGLRQLLPMTHNAATMAIDFGMSAVHDVLCEMPWEQIREEQRHATKLKTKLRLEAQKQLGDYGITVRKLQLNTLARCRVLKIAQSVSQEEN